MKRWLATWMMVLWCIGMAGFAPGHAHVWATGPDGHVHFAHAQTEHVLDPGAFDIHEHDQADAHGPALAETPDHHGHRLTVAQGNDTSRTPSASAVSPPSIKTVPHALIVAALLPRDEPTRGTIVGGDPPQPSPSLLQHRSVVLRI